MTANRHFKALVRQRMARTGERYTTARLHLLAAESHPEPAPSSHLFPSVTTVGGHQADVSAARNLVTYAGRMGPDGSPLSEAMAFGLAGGVGFLYGVFSYATGPTMTIVARNRSMPDPFLEPLFEAAGVAVQVETTGGAATAAKRVRAHLQARRPMLCTVGSGALPHLPGGELEAATSPHVVGVIGHDPDQDLLLLDDRSPNPIPVDRAVLAGAHAAYRGAKHRTITVTGLEPEHDWPGAVRSAVARFVEGFDTPPVPQFAANVGRAGLERWAQALTTTGAKSWAKLFDQGPAAAIGLSRLYECTTSAYTTPQAGRTLQVQFLHEAASVVGGDEATTMREAAELFATSGQRWQDLAEAVVEAHPEVSRLCTLADDALAHLDDDPDPELIRAITAERETLMAAASIPDTVGRDLYPRLGTMVGEIHTLESQALDRLTGR